MEQAAAPSKMQTGLIWGALLGVLTAALSFVEVHATMQGVAGLAGWAICIGALLGGQLTYRAKAASVSYGGAYLLAFFISLFGAIIGAVASFLVLNFTPGLMDQLRTIMDEAMASSAGAGGDPQTAAMVMDFMASPVVLSVLRGFGILIGGLIVGLITSIFARKDAKPEAAAG